MILMNLIYLFSLHLKTDNFSRSSSFYSINSSPFLNNRKTASLEESRSCIETLKTFYPNQKEVFIDQRITSTKKNAHKFYRSFPPLYHLVMEKQEWNSSFKEISKIFSVMGGDTHIENFGIRFFNGVPRLSINDFDDLTRGPIFFDVVRLFTSARLAGVKVKKGMIEEALAAYIKGLKGKEHEYSKEVEKLIQEATNTDEINPKAIDAFTQKFIKRKGDGQSLTTNQKNNWSKALSEKGTVTDSYFYSKDTGGSAGLERYELLVETVNGLKWLEAKEWSIPSFNVGSQTKAPSDYQRISWIKEYDHPEVNPEIVKINSKTFFIRHIDHRQIGIALKDNHREEIEEALNDEFYALGVFHATFLDKKSDYLNELNKISPKELKDFVETIKDDIIKMMPE
jgi:hypothetical protein